MNDTDELEISTLAATAPATGNVRDSDGQTWNNAVWTMQPVHSSGQKVVNADGSPAALTSGQLDATGTFSSGQMPLTNQMQPAGSTLTITICSVTSAPCQMIRGIQTTASTNIGTVLSALIQPPRIQAAALVYAYAPGEVVNPTSGDGYVNTGGTGPSSWLFVGTQWTLIGTGVFVPQSLTAPLTIETNGWPLSIDGNLYIQSAGSNVVELGQDGGVYANKVKPLPGQGNMILDAAGPGTSLEINYYDAGDAVRFGNGAGTQVAEIDKFGNFLCSGTAQTGPLTVEGPISPTNNVQLAANNQVNWPQGQCLIGVPAAHLIINPGGSTGAILLNWNNGAGVQFGNGAGAEIASVDPAGNLHANGNLSCGGSKPFIVTHPLDPNKKLTHVCIEGPECAVYYRGEGRTKAGTATVTLPAYFEALTRREGRTVQVSAIYDAEQDEFGLIAASDVANGTFAVLSSREAQRFCWEVKAVRADIPVLEVEQEAAAPARAAPA